MKIYISVDLEGVGGVVRPAQVAGDMPDYELTCHWATKEALAVIAGARRAGATEFWVKDAHGTGTNLMWDAFPEDVRLVSGRTRPLRFPGFDSSFAALFLVGYHAMAGTENAVLEHTWDYGTQFYLNGREIGEIAVDAAIAGSFRVPCALVTGDNKTAEEAREFLGAVETVIVKEAITSQGAICYPQPDVLRRLQAGAHSAVLRVRAGEFKPFLPPTPLHFWIAWTSANGATGSGEAHGDDARYVIREALGQA